MQNKNNTRFAALLITPVALLTVLAQNNTVAAPTNKVPVTVETAQTHSYTITIWLRDENNRVVPFYVSHVYFARPNQMRNEKNILRGIGKGHYLWINSGKQSYSYDASTNDYKQFPSISTDAYNMGFILPTVKPTNVLLKGESALLYTKITPDDNGTSTIKRVWLDAKTHEPLLLTSYLVDGKHHNILKHKFIFSNWKLNIPLDPALFIFTPPPGSKLVPNDNNTP